MQNEVNLPPYRVFTIYAIVFLVGIAISSYISFDYQKVIFVEIFIIALLLLSALLNFVFKNRVLIILSWSLIFVLLSMIVYSRFDKSFTLLPNYGSANFVGVIVSNPQVDSKKQRIVVRTDKLNNIDLGKSQRILIDAPVYPKLTYGDNVRVAGNVQKPGDGLEVSYQKYLKKNLIAGTMMRPDQIIQIGDTKGAKVYLIKKLYMISSYFEHSLNAILPEPQASLASGLILGIKRNIPDDLADDLSKSGLTHIIALSGFNVTIIMKVLSDLLRKPA